MSIKFLCQSCDQIYIAGQSWIDQEGQLCPPCATLERSFYASYAPRLGSWLKKIWRKK